MTLFGVFGLAQAALFMRRPSARRLAMVRAISWATVFSIFSAVSLNVASVFWKVPRHPEWSRPDQYPMVVMQGLAESLTPAILGFTVLGVVWFVIAVGHRRLGEVDVCFAAADRRKAASTCLV